MKKIINLLHICNEILGSTFTIISSIIIVFILVILGTVLRTLEILSYNFLNLSTGKTLLSYGFFMDSTTGILHIVILTIIGFFIYLLGIYFLYLKQSIMIIYHLNRFFLNKEPIQKYKTIEEYIQYAIKNFTYTKRKINDDIFFPFSKTIIFPKNITEETFNKIITSSYNRIGNNNPTKTECNQIKKAFLPYLDDGIVRTFHTWKYINS